MPRIRLKPNSAEYADPNKPHNRNTLCEMDGCCEKGEYKAPKHRGLNDYYHFCLDHVRDYNKAWNYFSGMNDEEVQEHLLKSLHGFRPTWKYGVNGGPTEALRDKIWQTYHFTDDAPPKDHEHHQDRYSQDSYSARQDQGISAFSPEFQALAIMGLAPPVTPQAIKTRYKELAKKHHPDLNKGCNQSEELLKQINMAYTILKAAFEKFETLPDRKNG